MSLQQQNKMKAAFIEYAGGGFKITETAMPVPQANEVLVKIYASGVNPLDTKIRAGKAAHAKHPFPAILGVDLAGVIIALGASVTQFNIGDEVYGLTGGIGGVQGSLAEYAAVDADLLALKPRNFSMEEAAALPLIFITAWEGLVDRANVQAHQKVLIQGGAGGVGHMALQIAKAFGAAVYATGSAESIATITRLGATAIDYQKQSVEEYVNQYTAGEGFDIIYDTAGGQTLDVSFKAAKVYQGHVVSCLGWGTHLLAPLSFKGATYSGVFTLLPILSGKGRKHHGEILKEAAKLAEAGKLQVLRNPSVYTFDTIHQAHLVVESGQSKGKVVITITTDSSAPERYQ